MLIFENIVLAVNGLLSNKMRALLTMLGIIIGIGSVIAIVTVGNSMTRGLSEEMQSFGANNLNLYVQQKPQENTEGAAVEEDFGNVSWASPEENDYISVEMLEEYRNAFSEKVEYISLSEPVSGREAKKDGKTSKINVNGVNIDNILSSNLTMLTGRILNEKDMEHRRHSAMVSDVLAGELFKGKDPIGQTIDIKINNDFHTFYIVGVYQNKASGGMFGIDGSTTTAVYIPISLAKSINNSVSGFMDATIVTKVGVDSITFSTETNQYFAKIYAKNRNFYAQSYSMQSMAEQVQSMFKTISVAISAIAGISLLVGGIGVMNIMLVSITERTREIGTRKALGATNSSIRLQFIVESMIICLIGGIIGIGLGLALGAVGSKFVGYSAYPTVGAIAIAVSFSMAIGVFFGYYPANKAAKLDPIEALRYE